MGNSHQEFRSVIWGILAVAVFLGLSTTALAVGEPESPLLPRVKVLGDGLANALLECPDRVWPGMNWQNPQVVFSDHQAKEAFVWNEYGSKDRIQSIDINLLPPSMAFGFYANGEWRGREALAINLFYTGMMPAGPMQKDFALTLATHEGFHFYVQTQWSLPEDQGSRATEYPADWEPRHLRFEMLNALVEAFEKGSHLPVYLSAAAYWRQELMNRFPGLAETYKSTDVAEGSASYMDGVSSAIAWGGCAQSERELLDTLRGALRTELVQLDDPKGEAFGHDHYSLGLLSGLIMREQGRIGWEHLVAMGQRPVDLVLEGVIPMAPPENHDIRDKVKAAVDQFNEETGKLVEPFLDIYSAPDSVHFAVPHSMIQGAFGTQGFVAPKAIPGLELILAIDVRFGAADGSVTGELKGQTAGVLEN
ncbi:MAG: hypothetical protein KDD43_11985, partial [Bdellovibrionales bacterium]|nr:hypothetical protein [Bdellovibrionales bacterium]